nr:MAG: hypothetical protein H1Rhizo26FD1521_000002 [Mitovirus sp.]
MWSHNNLSVIVDVHTSTKGLLFKDPVWRALDLGNCDKINYFTVREHPLYWVLTLLSGEPDQSSPPKGGLWKGKKTRTKAL